MNTLYPKTAFSLVELAIVIVILVALALIVLPRVATDRQNGRPTSCANNLKQLGLALKMYSNESKGERFPRQMYYYEPEVDCENAEYPVLGEAKSYFALSFNLDDMYPEYLPDLEVMVCPSRGVEPFDVVNNQQTGLVEMYRKCAQPDRGWHAADDSYWYFGHLLDKIGEDAPTVLAEELGTVSKFCSDKIAEGLVTRLNAQFAAWIDVIYASIEEDAADIDAVVDRDFDLAQLGSVNWTGVAEEVGRKGLGDGDFNTLLRLREGIERYLITDVGNDVLLARLRNEYLPTTVVMMDRGSPRDDGFAHNPPGCNVLYLDGHVDFVPHGTAPVTPEFLWVAECVRLAGQ